MVDQGESEAPSDRTRRSIERVLQGLRWPRSGLIRLAVSIQTRIRTVLSLVVLCKRSLG